MEKFADKWEISLRFRAANALSVNGVVKRNHHTIKWIAMRGETTPEEDTFWCSMTPHKDQDVHTVP